VYDHFTLPAISVVDVQALATKGSLNCLPATITRDSAYPNMPNPPIQDENKNVEFFCVEHF
jgi:hypothetical protein